MNENTELLKKALDHSKKEVAKVIIGHERVVDQALVAIFNGAHALIETPGQLLRFIPQRGPEPAGTG